MFSNDSEVRLIPRLMSRGVPVSLRSFCNFRFSTIVRGSAFGIRKEPFCSFLSFQISAFDLRRRRNSKHFRLEKIQIRSSGGFPTCGQS